MMLNSDNSSNLHFSQMQETGLKTKRAFLHENFNKLINDTLSELPLKSEENGKCCRQKLNWNDENVWYNAPNPKSITNYSYNDLYAFRNEKFKILKENLEGICNLTKDNFKGGVSNNDLLRKYFKFWKKVVKKKKQTSKDLEKKLLQREKLDILINSIEKKQHTDQQKKNSKRVQDRSNDTSKKSPKSTTFIKNRFDAQKNIIEMQKTKLRKQEQVINNLKLGIIDSDLAHSINKNKVEIREIFHNCSARLVPKLPLASVIEEREALMLKTQKAPNIVQKMEQRAQERMKYREIILDRKRKLEEAKKKMYEEALERKRNQDEEDKQRNLERIKERRQQEFQMIQIRQANKRRYLINLEKATNFHSRKVIKICFNRLKQDYEDHLVKTAISETFYRISLLKKVLYKWMAFIEEKYSFKYSIADSFYTDKILSRAFHLWHEGYMDRIRSMQVAEDVYDFRLQSNILKYWYRHVCKQIMLQELRMKRSIHHYDRKLLFYYFHLWKSLPAVLKLEKAKEERKQKWRLKVWEILPDYKPPRII